MEEEPNPPPSISLRRFELSDVDDMMEWVSDARVSRFMTWETIHSREEALDYLVTTIFPHPWYRAICLGGKPVGFISVRPGAGADRCRGEVSCGVARRHWGRGVVPAAVRMTTRAVFAELPQLERLDALVAVENRGAQRSLEKAGFRRDVLHSRFRILDGEVRDMVRYCFVRTASKL
ncbi:hypothetical protein Taro_004589 [Colocasia esculenta]|uniref:N-acetyltransferase domain-containing protein n=1 Tax=Colocasia esculenta TaxID=4460 RepID=A0A843TS41_COLES|nr:hypothetical protein [Colocasia esculenta]